MAVAGLQIGAFLTDPVFHTRARQAMPFFVGDGRVNRDDAVLYFSQ